MGSLYWADALPLSLHSSRAPDRRGNVKGSPCRDNPSTLMQDVGPATRTAHEIRDTGRRRYTTLGAYCSQCYLRCFGVLPSWALSEWISSECCICTGQLELAQRWATQQPRLSCCTSCVVPRAVTMRLWRSVLESAALAATLQSNAACFGRMHTLGLPAGPSWWPTATANPLLRSPSSE